MLTKNEKSMAIIFVIFYIVLIGFMVVDVNRLNREIDKRESRINSLNNTISAMKEEYNKTVENYEEKLDKLNESKFEISSTLEDVKYTKNRLQKRLSRKNVYHTPSVGELKDLVEESDVDEKEWTENYDCSEFSYDTASYLKENGIFSCTVEINFEDGDGHVIVAVNTTEGIIYVEPQDGDIFEDMDINDNYCDAVGWDCEWEIDKISSCFGLKY